MNCWHCQTELIYNGDQEMADDSRYSTMTNLSCPKCFCEVEVYLPRDAYD